MPELGLRKIVVVLYRVSQGTRGSTNKEWDFLYNLKICVCI